MIDLLSRLRLDAEVAFWNAVEVVHPDMLIPGTIKERRGRLHVADRTIDRPAGRIVVAALGKAAASLGYAFVDTHPSWCDELFLLAPHGTPVEDWMTFAEVCVRRGRHPVPDAEGAESCEALLQLAGGLGRDDLLVVLLSGGTSALLAAPRDGIALAEIVETTEILLRSGAPIGVLNAVRRRLLRTGGGGLARATFPARIVTLAISDVIGDEFADIGSGPTVPPPNDDSAALDEAMRILETGKAPESVRAALAAEPDDGPVLRIEGSFAAILVSNRTAVAAAAQSLEDDDFDVHQMETPIEGEAREVGARLARTLPESRRPFALVAGGETTVTVRGDGRGGRSQELALAAALAFDGRKDVVLLAAGTDGIDGASENAGAVVDGGTVERIRAAGIDPEDALAANDSATALEASGDTIRRGPTGTNVGDVVIVCTDPALRSTT